MKCQQNLEKASKKGMGKLTNSIFYVRSCFEAGLVCRNEHLVGSKLTGRCREQRSLFPTEARKSYP